MEIFICIVLFILGANLGSFYNVVGYRLPKGESLISPPSHCPKCNNRLGTLELIPILSYLFQGGKCKHCKTKIPIFYTIFELVTAILFVLAYLSYGFTPHLLIALTFISMLVIIVVSDLNFMIISDSVLITFAILLGIEIFVIDGFKVFIECLVNGLLAFLTMFALKKLGDYIFKKESMGGGDIKLMFLFGLTLGYPMVLLSIFLGSLIGLPISLFMMKKSEEHIIPFGPFLAVGALIIVLFQIDFDMILKIYGL